MAYAIEEQARKRTTIALAVLAGLLALVVTLVTVLVLRGGDDAAPAPDGGVDAGSSDSGGVTPRPAAEELNAETVVWEDLFGVPLPTSAAGPHDRIGNRAAGFDQSPAGAVLAAIHISYRASPSQGPAVFEETISKQVAGEDQDRFFARVQEEYASERARGAVVGPSGELTDALKKAIREESQVWGYRVDAYDSSAASVQVLLRGVPTGQVDPVFVNLATTVRWVDGEWRLVAPPTGDWSSIASQIEGVPAGYVVLGEA